MSEQIKQFARHAANLRRSEMSSSAPDDTGIRLASRSLPIVPSQGYDVVSGFYPYKNEIDVRPLLGKLVGEGWTTTLPIVIAKGEPLIFRRWLPGEPTVPGMWNIPQPPEQSPLLAPDVLLVPMLAFDRKGYRLGYGGGFYDRTLAKLRNLKPITAIGVAYAGQEIDSVPRDDHDQPLNYILTERELIRCV